MLHDAIQARSAMTFDRTSLGGQRTSRTVFPLGLFYWGGMWTLGGWCILRGAFREFRTDRMDSLEMLNETFHLSDDICLRSYIAHQSAARKNCTHATDTPLAVALPYNSPSNQHYRGHYERNDGSCSIQRKTRHQS